MDLPQLKIWTHPRDKKRISMHSLFYYIKSLSSASPCYFLLLCKQTTFVFSCSVINKNHFYMGGLEWPFFFPLFRFPLFYILHTCSVSEAHFVIWNICGTLLWRRPTVLLLLLPVFISRWFAAVVLCRRAVLQLASVTPGLHSSHNEILRTGREVLLVHNMAVTV